jgi:hypothetical protein
MLEHPFLRTGTGLVGGSANGSRSAKSTTYLRGKKGAYVSMSTYTRSTRRRAVTKQLSIETMVCSEYQKLLEETGGARDIWEKRRAEICRSRLVGKEAGDELLRLQANYARAYTRLRKHVQDCHRCQLVSKIA